MRPESVKDYFGVVDIIIFAIALVLSALIGVYYAYKDRNKKTLKNYYYGGKKMSPIPLGLSMSVTFISAITVMSFPADTYMFGLITFWYSFTSVIPTIVACLYFIPLHHRLQLNTIYELLENRFHVSIRKICSAIEIFGHLFYNGFTIYLPALALNAVTPLQLSWSIALTGGLGTVYTTIGGIKAVVWTDALQSVFMFVGVMAAAIKGAMEVGGFENIMESLQRNGGMNLWRFDLDPRLSRTFWVIIFGFGGNFMTMICTSQAMMQRYLSCKSVKDARIAAGIALVPKVLISLSCVFGGAVAYAYFDGCDPLKQGILKKEDQIMPYFVLILFRNLPGLVGFYVAAVYSGTLSTVSSGINSLAALILDDFVLSIKPSMSNNAKLRFSKWSVFILGILVTSIAYLASVLGGSAIKMLFTFKGASSGPVLGVFILAIFVPWATTKGALAGQLAGTCLSLTLGCGSYFYGTDPKFQQRISHSADQCTTENIVANSSVPQISLPLTSTTEMLVPEKDYPGFFSLSFMLFGVVGVITTVVVGVIVSFVTGANNPEKADPAFFQPLVDNPCFPESVRSFFRFGVPELKLDLNVKEEEIQFGSFGSDSLEEKKDSN